MRLGDMSANEALGIVSASQQKTAANVNFVSEPQANGFPGINAVLATAWNKIFGTPDGIVTPPANAAPVVTTVPSASASTPLILGVVAAGALFMLAATRRTGKSRYRRMKARRK